MIEDIKNIKIKFEKIKQQGWIESKRSGSTGIGYTLESLFNKEENNFEIPDFCLFELKAHSTYPNSYITLFNATPDGDYLFETERLKETYGYPDKNLKQFKVLNCDVFANSITNLGAHYKQIIKINNFERKLKLHILDNNLNLIDNEVSWSFDMLKDKFERKLKFLAYVEADKKKINGIEYFKYENINFYKAYDFDQFIKLIEKGIIKISFKIGIFKSGKRYGQTHDHGTSFSISEEKLSLLYKKIEC